MTASPRRSLVAAGLLAALLAALLGAWFTSGWADVRSRQRAVRDAPRLEAGQRGADLAHELGGELAYRPAPGGGAAFVLTLARA